MKRRDFIKTTTLAASAMTVGPAAHLQAAAPPNMKKHTFHLHYAPHLGMFKHHAGEDPIDQLNFMADEGFTAFEDNGMKGREITVQEKMAETMQKRGMTMGVFVAHKIYWKDPNLASGDPDWLKEFLNDIRTSVEVAKRVNARWMTVVPGHVALNLDEGYQTANVVEALKRACDILEPHGLTMVLEPLNFRDHPGLFLTKMAQAYQICKAVDSASCKILCDIYHQQITEGNLLPNIIDCWDEIAYFQMGDNPGRKEPTTGEINYKNIFKHIFEKGFDGIMGMEHGNSKAGKEGERAVIDAYKEVDSFS